MTGSADYIGNKAFLGCSNLVAVILPYSRIEDDLYLTSPILLGTDVFVDTPIANGTGFIYVRDALVDSYKTDENWSTWASQIKPLSEYTGAV